MKLRLHLFAVCLALALGIGASLHSADESASPYVTVASYANTPAGNKEGAKAMALLKAKGIAGVSCGSAGMSLNVLEPRSVEARRVLAKAVLADEVHVDLIEVNAKGDRAVVVTPESVLNARVRK